MSASRQVAGRLQTCSTPTPPRTTIFVEGDNALVDIPGAAEMVTKARLLRGYERSPASTWWSACAARASGDMRPTRAASWRFLVSCFGKTGAYPASPGCGSEMRY
jgi:hypothetical protein